MGFKRLVGLCAGVWLVLGGMAQAATLTITITNTTVGHPFKGLLIVAHGVNHRLFNSGYAATDGLEALAECGEQGILTDEVRNAAPRADVWGVEFDAGLDKLMPGATITIGPLVVTDAANTRLSIVGRMMATNDGFVGLEATSIPIEPDSDPIAMLVYDAGTEGNNELFTQTAEPVCSLSDLNMAEHMAELLPDDPYLGVNGTGASALEAAVTNTSITIHRGVLGDTYASGGGSDLDFVHHRWTNPVATVTVTVQ